MSRVSWRVDTAHVWPAVRRWHWSKKPGAAWWLIWTAVYWLPKGDEWTPHLQVKPKTQRVEQLELCDWPLFARPTKPPSTDCQRGKDEQAMMTRIRLTGDPLLRVPSKRALLRSKANVKSRTS
ncbi:hypothetical protein B0I37DRAFT_2365 [Chaetomium sp. MPI-CAGE-AT-0009]|nr:hypothetical protein B0I37DRAFT_2365 [Chaetomium sp. MPI-CAGE-AT-0009]